MRRREFITLLGGAAGWPLAASAQQAKPRTIGFMGASASAAVSSWVVAFVQRLRELGWREGLNLSIEYRWAEGRFERLAGFADEFVRQEVDIIVAEGTVTTLAAKRRPLSRSFSRSRETQLATSWLTVLHVQAAM